MQAKEQNAVADISREPWKDGLAGPVYVVWGSTYLATRVVIDSLPPLLMASIRFIVAGALFLIWSLASREGEPRSGQAAPGRKDWAATLLTGAAMVLIGNGAVAWAARSLPSGIVAVLMASVPL